MKGGGIDHTAVISARFHGWKTRTFPDRVCGHHRKMGTAEQNKLGAKFKLGWKDRTMGNHPLWEIFRATYQMTKRPYLLGGLSLGWGYLMAVLKRAEVPLPPDMVAFVRREQIQRLKRFVLPGARTATNNNLATSPTQSAR